MGFLRGGTADKLGNRYEGQWVVKQLLLVLAERVHSVQLEAIGSAEEGVDLWVQRLNGIRDAQQCKAFNSSKPSWTVAELKLRGVLDKAVRQLRTASQVEFTFVSTILATELEDLTRNARESSENAEAFYEHFVQGKPRERAFNSFCDAVNLVPSAASDRLNAFDLLTRLHVCQFQDDRSTRDDLRSDASVWLTGRSPDVAIAALKEIAQANLHRILTATDLYRFLEQYGLRARSRADDPRVATKIESLREHFVQSIEPQLAAGKLIPRQEVNAVLELLQGQNRPDAIVVHGAPGCGKSGVLYQLESVLRKSGNYVCAFRLDRKPPRSMTAHDYGVELGLPGSPALVLNDLSGGRPATLIVDQLDALRWTNAHAEQGLDICRELLRQVRSCRAAGAEVDIVFACRTFDLDRDPEISEWLSKDRLGVRIAKVEVSELSLDVIQAAVSAEGIEPSSLRSQQLKLLQSVQRLAMWVEIVKSERNSPTFSTSTQLMRHFWKNRRAVLEKAGCNAAQRDEVIGRIVRYMEEHACLSAPESLLGTNEKLVTELQSSGVVSVRDGTVTFGHQTNLDFLIASRALAQMAVDGTNVLQWLGECSQQSLFRREQLRQVLFLMADDRHQEYLSAIATLLESPGLRFHLRQLALETLSQIQPTTETFEFVFKLLGDSQWREHVQLHVIHGSVAYVGELHNRSQLLPMLFSKDELASKRAINWLWSIHRTEAAFVASILRQLPKTKRSVAIIAEVVGYDGYDAEPDELFHLRLRGLRHGAEFHYANWADLAAKHPVRAIQLFDAVLAGWIVQGAKRRIKYNGFIQGKDGLPSLLKASREHPKIAWKLLRSKLKWFVVEQRRRRRFWKKKGTYCPYDALLRRPCDLLHILTAAAQELCRTYPDDWLSIAHSTLVRRSEMLSAFFANSLRHLPASYADSAIDWLLDDPRRLTSSHDTRKPRWRTAARLIRKMSRHCSDAKFRELEQRLLTFRDPEEKRLAKYWLQSARQGHFCNEFGVAQYFLLPALDLRRRSLEVVSRIGVLTRKFESYPLSRFAKRMRGWGGTVRSPIDDGQRWLRMSDSAWLKLIAQPNERPEGAWSPRRGGGIIESSLEMLSRSFGRAASRYPDRFVKLGLKLPQTTNHRFVAELLRAMALESPPSEVPEDARAAWTKAPSKSVAHLLATIRISRHRSVVQSFCRVVQARRDLPLKKSIVKRLFQLASHRHPRPNKLVVDCNENAATCDVKTLESNSINVTRGEVAHALEAVLWRNRQLIPRAARHFARLARDQHPAVRMAAIRFCYPVWKENKSKSIKWLVRCVSNDMRLAASYSARELYNFAFPEYAEVLSPIIRQMIQSPYDDVAEVGAAQAAARWVYYDLFTEEFRTCLVGSDAQRKGVADALSQLVRDKQYTDRCLPEILKLLNDDSEKVRTELSAIVHPKDFFELDWAPTFLHKVTTSKLGNHCHQHLLWNLKDLPGPIEKFSDTIFAIADAITEDARRPDFGSGKKYWDVDGLTALLLRLYERASGDSQGSVRQECLDTWDALLESRSTIGWALTRGLDKTQF